MKTTLPLILMFFILFSATAQIVNIPDPVFKQRLIDEGVDTNDDNEIQVSEAEAVTGALDVNGQFDDISDLTGIEAFVNITELYCQLNALTTLDLSQNTALVNLFCMDNPLTNLNVTQCIALELLEAEHTQLTSIDLSNNINLITLIFRDSQLTSLDLTNNINLEGLSCSFNKLTFLDLRSGNNTTLTSFTSEDNPNLKCIFVDDVSYSEGNPGWFKDPTSTYVETQAECDALGVIENESQNIRIYPNPVKNTLYVDANSEFTMQNYELIITDIMGKKLIQTYQPQQNSTIYLGNLHPGIYFLTISNNNKILLTKKILKL